MPFAIRLDDPSRADRYAAIHRSTKIPGMWQLTEFDRLGPARDSQGSLDELIEQALRENMTIVSIAADSKAEARAAANAWQRVAAARADRAAELEQLERELDQLEKAPTNTRTRGQSTISILIGAALVGGGVAALYHWSTKP